MRTVGVRLMADVSQYMSNLRRAGAATKDFTGQLGQAASAGHLDAVADSAGMAGLALGGVAVAAVKLSMDFEKAMSGVKAATHASASDMQQLRAAALKAGADTSYSATEAAKAITELSKAGVATSDVLRGGLSGALSLAAAGQMDVGEAAETAASAMTQFKLKGADVPHIADLLAAAAGKAQGTVHDMGQALNQAGLVAAQTGLTIEETTGGLAAFASAGLTGSDAGTSFKQMLMMLQAPSDKSKELMKELGITLYDAQGKFVGLSKFAGQLRIALKDLTPEARAAAMAQIFGADATRAASVMFEQGAEGVQKWIEKVNDSGYAAKTAAIQTDNLAGDLERLRGSLETMAIEAGGGANSGLRVLVKSTEALVDEFAQLPAVVSGTVTVLAGVGGAALALGAGWVMMRRRTADMLAELREVGPNGERAASGLQSVSKWAGRATAAFIAFEVASAAVSAFQTDLNPKIEALAKGLEGYAAGGKLAGESSRVLGEDLSNLHGTFKLMADESNTRRKWASGLQGGLEALIPGLEGTNTSLARTRERVTAMDAALAQLVQGGKTGEAKAAFDRLAQSLAVGGVSLDEFKKQFPGYAAALEVAGKATGGAAGKTGELSSALQGGAGAQKEYKTVTDAAAAAIRGERDALSSLTSMIKAEVDPVFALIDADRKLADAKKAVAKATKEHGAKSVEAKDATRNLATAALELQGRAGALGDTFNGKMTPALRGTLKAAGLTDGQIRNLSGQFAGAKKSGDSFAKKYAAQLSVSGYEGVVAKLDRVSAYQAALKKGMPVGFHGPVVVNGRGYHDGGRTAAVGEHEPAGVVHGREFVFSAATTRKIDRQAPGLLDDIHATGGLPGYAAGGRVGWPFPATAAMARILSRREAAAVVVPAGPSGGATGPWMERLLESRFGVDMISGFRPGSRTLSGNLSYHARNRAVDFPPLLAMARYMYQNFKSRLKEAITPYQQYNVHNGQDRRWTGAVWRQHNFAGGNAHNHFAMVNGGVIGEPVVGVGRSGATYSFAENGPERVLTAAQTAAGGGSRISYQITVNVPPTVNMAEVGRVTVAAIQEYERGSGARWRS